MNGYRQRALGFLVLVVFTAWGLTVLASGDHQEFVFDYHAVYLDGRLLGYAEDASWVDNLVETMLEMRTLETGFQVSTQEDLQIVSKSSYDPPQITDANRLRRSLERRLSFVTHAVGLEIDGEVVAVLPTEYEARWILERIVADYRAAREADGRTEVLSVDILEDVQFVRMPTDPETILDSEAAERILLRGTDRLVVHEVQRGDTAWGIAHAASLTVDQLQEANPGTNVDRIFPGDELHLIVPDPYLTLRSEEEAWYIRYVPNRVEVRYDENLWPWERVVERAGRSGEVRVTVRVVTEAGGEVEREIISEEELSEPVTRIVRHGTKTIPRYGSGRFILPASGTLTSGFGWRSRGFHYGIDLAMPIGTPIKAADGGMVSAAGYAGNYGIMIEIDHGEGEYVTVYAHLSRTAVSVGNVVQQGDVIGYSGNTGRSTGPHLHFEIRVNGVPKNPTNFFTD